MYEMGDNNNNNNTKPTNGNHHESEDVDIDDEKESIDSSIKRRRQAPPEDIEIAEIDDDDEDEEEEDDDEEDDDEEEEEDEEEEDDDLVVIEKSPQPSNDKTSSSSIPLANDFEATAARLMKPLPDYPIKDETHYVWHIKDWSGIKEEKVRSPQFECGGFNWNILLFPKGNNQSGSVSLYMEPHPIIKDDNEQIPDDWYVCAQFGLDIWNPNHPESHLPSGSHHRFSKHETDWGFSSLIDNKSLASSSIPRLGNQLHAILENNQLNITGYVKVIDDSSTGVLWHNFNDYDSKKHAGFVGLNNQGATCYLNSLLQSYFTTKVFRKLVYQIPTMNNSSTSSKQTPTVPLSLQRIFYLLSTSNAPVGTLELTKSFGWDSSDAFTQHDVQELNRILMDRLETAMKGSDIEGKLNDIFVGKMKSYIKCVNVPYESSRVEDFWDIQLNVRGFKNLQESFKNYIEIEMLDGENRYQAGDDYGYQDAKKGVVFESFPPVLHLQLKRFEYDFMVDDLVKIDDFYEFPDKIDLKPYLDEDLPAEIKNQNWNYKLHGVLVHQGSISNGHYYAMIKPNGNDDVWLRFDDDKVWRATKTQVFHENFGANEITTEELSKLSRLEQQENLLRRVTSAYMLVYYRESQLEEILPINENMREAIPEHIPRQLKEESEERERLERLKQEELYYTETKFITTSTINNHIGFDLALDSTIPKFCDETLKGTSCDPISFKVKKDDPYYSLYKLVGKQLKYFNEDDDNDEQQIIEDDKNLPFRLIIVCHRNNHTNRVDSEVIEENKDKTINSVYFKSFNRKFDEFLFYIEEVNKDINNINQAIPSTTIINPRDFKFETVFEKINQVGTTVNPEFKFHSIYDHSNHMILFIKYFDPISQEIRGLSHIVVSKDSVISKIIKPINELLNFDPETNLQLFEEFSPSKIDKIDTSLTLNKLELSNGDIITVQVPEVAELAGDKKFKDLREYYKFMLTRIHIQVKPFKADLDEEDSDFVVEENKNGNGNSLISPSDTLSSNEELDDVSTRKQIEAAKRISKSFDFWISTLYTYQELAEEIASKLGSKVDPTYLRIFVLNNQGSRYPLKSSHHLSTFLPKTVPVNQIISFEYEILNIKLRDYENLKSVKIHWLTSLLQYQVFELLVARNGSIRDLIIKLLHKVSVSPKDYKHIFVWSGRNHSYYDFVKFDRPLEDLEDDIDLYAGIFPAEIEILTSHDMIKRFVDESVNVEDFDNEFLKEEFIMSRQLSKDLNLIPAFHFYKNSTYHHGVPFIFAVYPGEKFSETKERLRKKLGLGLQAFEKIRFALADNQDKGSYIDSDNEELILFNEIGKVQLSMSLALDHPDRSSRRTGQFDKGISIR
ncbi:ubiquitin carboxyl-terminal hydrolase [Scheffersomyces amazonensis]|uniref:ubiquitin carboxyl-terminal hydrolase n=1 Tax=Scheffersomyces amazonensis TaxID=1078765 RepID=UPI00315DB222